MARHVGQCSNCGEAAHPKGNVFRIMPALYWEIDFPRRELGAITSEYVKVCNNCNTPHPFHRRVSAKSKKMEALLVWLLEQEDS